MQDTPKIVSDYRKYKAAISIRESDLNNLEKFLKKYCNYVCYEVTQKHNLTRHCDSVHEVTRGDNFLDNRVLALQIHCYYGSDEIISIFIGRYFATAWVDGIQSGFFCQYKLPEQVAHNFIQELNHFLKSIREAYSPFTRLSVKNVFFYVVVSYLILKIIFKRSFQLNSFAPLQAVQEFLNKIYQKGSFTFSIFLAGIVILFMLLLALDLFIINPFFLRNLFPPISFVWGKELEHYEVVKKRREHFLWGGIITFILSIIAGIVVGKL